MKKIYTTLTIALLGLGSVFAQNPVVLKQQSITPSLVNVSLPGVSAFGLIGTDDLLPKSPSFRFGGMADGTGIIINDAAVENKNVTATKGTMATVTGMYNPKGTYLFLTNHEDNLGVSRVYYDQTFKPLWGDYVVNSNVAQWRLCSATMAIPEEHGFGPVFFTCGEAGPESMTLAVDPFETPNLKNISPADENYWEQKGGYMSAWGRWSAENAVPLNKAAYPGKVAIILGDDDSGFNSQVVLIVGELTDFQNKIYNKVKVYVLRRAGFDFTTLSGAALTKADYERGMTGTTQYDVEFVEIPSITGMTGAAINSACDVAHAIRFGRVEDLDYRKSTTDPGKASREIFFNVTGQEWGTGSNPFSADLDPVTMTGWWNGTTTGYGTNGYTAYTTSLALPSMYVFSAPGVKAQHGRVYKLVLDDADMLKGKLSILWDADARSTDPADVKNYLMNCDNITATEDYLYIEEDPNRYSDGGKRANQKQQFLFNYENHDSRIYQYNLVTGEVKVLIEQDHRRTKSDNVYYNQSTQGQGTLTFTNPNPTGTSYRMSIPGDWEYGDFIDISQETGVPGSYVLSNQTHTWQSLSYIRPDGGSRPNTDGYKIEASNLVLFTGVPQKAGANPYSIEPETPTWYWYTTSVGGTAISSGKHLVTSVTSNMTYYVAYGTSHVKSARREPVSITAVDAVVTTLTGIEDLAGISAFNIYPNPNEGTFTLSFEAGAPSALVVEIFDLDGKLVYLDKVSTVGLYKKSISVTAKGTYLAKLTSGSKSVTKKVVVE